MIKSVHLDLQIDFLDNNLKICYNEISKGTCISTKNCIIHRKQSIIIVG